MEERPMTGEEVMKQLLSSLNGNGMQQQSAYIVNRVPVHGGLP